MASPRIAVVTGGASGIGRATARCLAAGGDLVIVADCNETAGAPVVGEIGRAGGRAEFRRLDVAEQASVDELMQAVEGDVGPIAVLVNSAGVLQNAADIATFDLAEHDRVWAINYRGTYLCCRAVAPRMTARRAGSIVNISSTSALGAMPLLAYGPGKAAVQNLTAILAVELGPDNVRVNAVVPGYVLTEQMQARIDAGKRDPRSMKLHSALGRMVAPEDVANGIHFLCSDAASCITGIALPIDAGYLAAVTPICTIVDLPAFIRAAPTRRRSRDGAASRQELHLLDRIDGATHLYYVVGDPIAQVKAPARMTHGFAQRGANAVLVPAHVAASDLDAFLEGASRTRNVDGMIMTVPHKLAAYRHCAAATERARFLRAVNVLRRDAGARWYGDTTDGASFVAVIRAAGCEPRGLRALVVGAGGAASAIAVQLIESGVAELAIHSRTPASRDRLIGLLGASLPGARIRAGTPDPTGFDLVVNGTPAGMRADDGLPVMTERLQPTMFVGDVVTMPEITPLLAAARAARCRTTTGIDMVTAAVGLMLDFFLAGDSARTRKCLP